MDQTEKHQPHGPKLVTVFVNQDEHTVPKEKISYDEVVALYLQKGGAASTEYLIKYSRGHSANITGTLAPGQEVMVKDGMRFRISGTGES
jgi:Multiubiquitin